MKTNLLVLGIVALAAFVAFATGCGPANNVAAGKTIVSGPAGNNLTAALSNADGELRKGKQEFTLTFTDAAGKAVDVGSVALNYRMPAMGGMSEMNNGATFTTTGTPGVYLGKAEIEMAGGWQAQITYEGPAGKGSFSLPINAK